MLIATYIDIDISPMHIHICTYTYLRVYTAYTGMHALFYYQSSRFPPIKLKYTQKYNKRFSAHASDLVCLS